MSNYPNGKLLIGGYLPCWLFNYVMSYVLRYLMSHYKTRREKKIRLIEKCVCYADDFIIFGTKANLIKALKLTKNWLQEKFNLTIKQPWLIIKNNDLIDMMGFKININNEGAVITTIRKTIFKKLRRQFIRANNELKTLSYIPFYRASKIISYWGFIEYSNSYNFIIQYDANWIFYKSKESISRREKKITMERQEYLTAPAEVEIHFLSDSNKTDIILRKDIQQEEKQNYETSSSYYVYTCEEIQGRIEGQYTKENIESNFDGWWILLEQEKNNSKNNNRTLETAYARMAVGNYVGTGTFGDEMPTALTFNFTPSFISINNEQIYFTAAAADNEDKKTFYISSNESAEKQYNEKGKTYNYIALGY